MKQDILLNFSNIGSKTISELEFKRQQCLFDKLGQLRMYSFIFISEEMDFVVCSRC